MWSESNTHRITNGMDAVKAMVVSVLPILKNNRSGYQESSTVVSIFGIVAKEKVIAGTAQVGKIGLL